MRFIAGYGRVGKDKERLRVIGLKGRGWLISFILL